MEEMAASIVIVDAVVKETESESFHELPSVPSARLFRVLAVHVAVR